jgi:hypothetical protein
MSIGSGSPPGGVGSAGIPGMSGGASGWAGTSGTDSGTTYSACIAPETFPGVRSPKRRGAGGSNHARRGRVLPAVRTVLLRAAVIAASIAMLAEAPAPTAPTAEETAKVLAMGSARNAVHSYTSKLHVDLALRSFPYLKFHLEGHVEYKRPNTYSVHFERVPWFGKGFENMKMDPLEPQTWPDHYDIASIVRSGGRAHVEMHDKIAGNIKGVHAELDNDGLRRIAWLYTNGGNIDVSVNPTVIEGVPVPASEDADIKLPAYHVVAHATFTDYKIITDQTVASGNLGR